MLSPPLSLDGITYRGNGGGSAYTNGLAFKMEGSDGGGQHRTHQSIPNLLQVSIIANFPSSGVAG